MPCKLSHFLGICSKYKLFFILITGAKYSTVNACCNFNSMIINSFFIFLFSISSKKPEAIIQAGKANKPTPRTAISQPKNFPVGVIGLTSSPPIVAKYLLIPYQSEVDKSLNDSGCALCSKK